VKELEGLELLENYVNGAIEYLRDQPDNALNMGAWDALNDVRDEIELIKKTYKEANEGK
jgi:hypothetical protein